MTTEALVLVARHGGVAVLTLNLADRRNVMSAELVEAIAERFDQLENDPTVRCVVLTGAGTAFCAGAELSVLQAASRGEFDSVETVYGGFLRVLASPLPTIAAVNGPAVGAGFNLALACDLRLAGRSALFDTRFAQLHIHPGGGHTWLLARAVGQQQATLACLFGETWTADRAQQVGLVASVHDDAALLDDAIALGRRLDGQELQFICTLLSSLRESLVTPTHAEALKHETAAQRWSTTRPAFKDGLAALEAKISKSRAR